MPAISFVEFDPATDVDVEVDELDAACESARALGAELILPPTTIPRDRRPTIARVRDPHGNIVGLVQRR